jgi:hypothetical protein
MTGRPYDASRDRTAVHRIWQEVGWVKEEEHRPALDAFLTTSRTRVADVDGVPECMVASVPGTLRYLKQDLPLSAVTAVVTSLVARKQGLAGRLTAALVADDAARGALVSALGMFEQGYYDRLGFGTGSYEHWLSFDPAQLRVGVRARPPRRLTAGDWPMVHRALLGRQQTHGTCSLYPPEIMQAEMVWTSRGFGLGYCDGPSGELTHFIWGSLGGEFGPLTITFMAFRDGGEFLELMALLKALADQVREVLLCEPQGIQMQDLLDQPFRYWLGLEEEVYDTRNRASAYWQVRLCDVPGCLARTHLRCEALRFNLKLHDPIEAFLGPDAPWRGVGGPYVVTLGSASSAAPGEEPSLPTLEASCGAFSRLWLGVRPATGLAVTDELAGPAGLLEALDEAFRLPLPHTGWDF